MTQILTRALLVAAVLGSALWQVVLRTDETRKPRPGSQPQPTSQRLPAGTTEQQTAGEAVDDAVVTAKVKAKLVDDEVTKAYQIEVETFQGSVQLSGSVDSEEARSRAAELAKDVGGVKDVKNSLQVRKSDG